MGILVKESGMTSGIIIMMRESIRQDSQFRNWITKDGSAGPTGEAGFKAEPNRYHLYVSLACPWASRALIMRSLKGLERS